MRKLYLLLSALALLLPSCSPKLSSEDRAADIRFLAQWADDYSPFVELNEKYKACPDYRLLEPQYVRLAENAPDNSSFLQVLYGYFSLIGTSGHAYLVPRESLGHYMLNDLLSNDPCPISWMQFHNASYWAGLFRKDLFVHPPFRIVRIRDDFFTDNDWRHRQLTIPRRSRILSVNGMTSLDWLEYARENTWLRYLAADPEWMHDALLAVPPPDSRKGWDLEFQTPDGATVNAFVPAANGRNSGQTEFTDHKKRNCVCLSLTDRVAYIRIKSFSGQYIDADGKKIRKFLDRSEGRYERLIIDIRNNPGGFPWYFYDNLIRPFLDEPVTYSHIVGIKKKFLRDYDPEWLRSLRFSVSTWAWEKNIEETQPPEDFDPNLWTFYKITRTIEPSEPYAFRGKIFVLINENCYSAADDYPNTLSRIGIATLVGRTTGGAGGIGYFAPVLVRLPASGIIFMLEADVALNPDASFNELVGTRPDITIPPAQLPESATTSELLQDPWIKALFENN